jgi:predicted phage terminase large subunit-like protein
VIESDVYKQIFKPDWELREDQNTLTKFTNTKGGSRRAVSVGSTITGDGATYLVCDDPHDVGEIYSELARERVKFWYDKTLSTRVDHPEHHAKVVIMQRLHEDDLAGHLLKRGDYETLILPGEYDPEQDVKSQTSLGFKDPRTKPGELLWPEFWTPKSLDELREILGEDAEAQINQVPKSKSGGLFLKTDWKRYQASPSNIVQTGIFIDAAQKPGVTNDYTVIAVWAQTLSGYFLLDLLREKTDAPLLQALTVKTAEFWRPDFLLIEDKSAGSSLIQYLRSDTTLPVLAFDPLQRDKVVRATAAVPTVRAGKCYLPERIQGLENGKLVNLVDVFIKEHETFPRAKHDDMVDTTSMMVEYFNKHGAVHDAPLIMQL